MKIKRIIATILFATTLTGTALAASGKQNITAHFDNIKIVLNGKELTTKDSAGTIIEPFIINGTTYLPVRAIGEALGLEVKWDGKTKAIFLTDIEVKNLVYVTKTGKCYHYNPTCNGGTYYESMLDEALTRGLTPCDKCVIKNSSEVMDEKEVQNYE